MATVLLTLHFLFILELPFSFELGLFPFRVFVPFFLEVRLECGHVPHFLATVKAGETIFEEQFVFARTELGDLKYV